jgi:uroporphyrin-III C-methyltransferase/precorrin-2 dehydrogenase/sirohydrochlorin ferrochelatase
MHSEQERAQSGDGATSGHYYPVLLDLRGRRVVVLGGGTVATQKVRGLVDAGASITIISPVLSDDMERIAATGDVTVLRREYRVGDLEGVAVAIAATDDRSVNHLVWEEARRRNVLLNAVDDVPHCDFIAPSVHRRGDITVTVSSAGKCPALAVRLRERIGTMVGDEHARAATLLGGLREEIARAVPDVPTRTRLWYRIVDSAFVDLVRRGDEAGALALARDLVNAVATTAGTGHAGGEHISQSRERYGVVHLVGAGPGDPGLITARGLELIESADVILYDRLVATALLLRARPGALLVPVGKTGYGASTSQEKINQMLVRYARRGMSVVRLKGGDPFVFGRGGEECEALAAAGITFHVIPGVTSAIAAPALAGIPVTHRTLASGFAVITGHQCTEPSTLDWGTLARIPTLVVMMGLKELGRVTTSLSEHGLSPDTPAAVIANASLPEQQVITGTLASIDALVTEAGLPSPATLVIGEVVRLRGALHADTSASEGTLTFPAPAELRVGVSTALDSRIRAAAGGER